jgi:hypothetical protein
LRADEKVAISVAVSFVRHVGVEEVDVESDAITQVWVAAPGKSVETVCEVDVLVLSRKWKG